MENLKGVSYGIGGGGGVVSGGVIGGGGSGEERTCDTKDSRIYPGGRGRDRGDGAEWDGLCWEGVGEGV